MNRPIVVQKEGAFVRRTMFAMISITKDQPPADLCHKHLIGECRASYETQLRLEKD